MSHSGIPGIQDLAQMVSGPTTFNNRPQAPSSANNPTLDNPKVAQAEADEDQQSGRGEAANMLFQGSGMPAMTSRSVLLGS